MADEKKSVPAKVKKPKKRSISKWLRELKAEMKKIVWSTRRQVLNNTFVVIVAVLIVGIFVWILDLTFGFGRDILISTLS